MRTNHTHACQSPCLDQVSRKSCLKRFCSLCLSTALLVLAMTFSADKVYAQEESPWHIVADSLAYDKNSGMLVAEGNVVVTHEDKTLNAEFVEYDRIGESIFARGKVELTSRGDRSVSERVLLNLKNERGVLYNTSIFIESNHVYIKGDEIRRTGESTYTADKVSITTCDGDNPDWRFTGEDLSVTIEGYGTIYNAAFWTRKIPVVYSPFLVFPVKIQRQSGLLPPEFGLSERKGFEYLQPLFWTINESSDATFYNRYIEKRGNMAGLEYRYILSEKSKGTLLFDYMKDDKIEDGSVEDMEKWGYEDKPIRDNRNRYWFRMKQDQALPGGALVKVDADVVSDQDYLREFSDMKNGYSATKKDFFRNFGRDIEAEDDAIRTNSMVLTKTWSTYSLNASTIWYDNVVKRVDHLNDYTVQKLPTIEFNSARRQLLGSGLYYAFETEYDYFFRKDITNTLREGQRADLFPKLILPWRYKNLFSVEGTAGFRQTNWYVPGDSNVSDDLDGTHSRQMVDLNIDLSTNLYRIYNLGAENVDRIRHAFTPKLTYSYVPEKDQTEYPYFDALDRINRENTLTLNLVNTFTSRSKYVEDDDQEKKDKDKNSDQALSKAQKYHYNQFCRVEIEQAYDINEANETDPDKFLNKTSKEPFLPLYGEIEFTPFKYLSFDADAKWSHYDRCLLEGNTALSMKDDRGDLFRIENRYTRDSVKYLRTYLNLQVTDKLSVYGLNERDLMVKEDLKSSVGFLYTSQCWGVQVDYTHKPGDKRYGLIVQLSGLGEIGS